MWFLFLFAALAAELVPEWEAYGTAISPETALDAALIEPGLLMQRQSFLQRASEPVVVGEAIFQLFTVMTTGDGGQATSLIAERHKKRSHIPLFRGDNDLMDAIPLPGGLVQITWGSDAAVYATIVGFDTNGVIQKVAQDIPLRIGLQELRLAFLGPRMVVAGRGVSSTQSRWIGRHNLKIRPPRQKWRPRSSGIPLGEPAPAPPHYDSVGELRVNDYALQWGHFDSGGPTHDAVWVYTPQGTVPLLEIPDQNGRPARLRLRAFRRLHGHVYWAEIELTVAGVDTDTAYYLGWILKLRRDEARIVADQIPVRDGGAEDTRLLIDVPTADALVIEAATEELTYWQRSWLGTWKLE